MSTFYQFPRCCCTIIYYKGLVLTYPSSYVFSHTFRILRVVSTLARRLGISLLPQYLVERGKLQLCSYCRTLAWAPIAKYWQIIRLWSLTWCGVVFYWSTIRKQFEGHVKVISRSNWQKLLPWSHVFFRAVPNFFSNVSSLKGAWASFRWHVGPIHFF